MGGYRDRTTNTVNKIFDVAIRKYQLLENICEDDHELSFAIGSIYDLRFLMDLRAIWKTIRQF
jgi:hypothetical protein